MSVCDPKLVLEMGPSILVGEKLRLFAYFGRGSTSGWRTGMRAMNLVPSYNEAITSFSKVIEH